MSTLRCGGSEEVWVPCSRRHSYGCGGPNCDDYPAECPGCKDCGKERSDPEPDFAQIQADQNEYRYGPERDLFEKYGVDAHN